MQLWGKGLAARAEANRPKARGGRRIECDRSVFDEDDEGGRDKEKSRVTDALRGTVGLLMAEATGYGSDRRAQVEVAPVQWAGATAAADQPG